MTKKDYIKLAKLVKDSTEYDQRPDDWEATGADNAFLGLKPFVRDLMVILAQDNARFDRARFWAACGLPREEL